MRRIFTLSFALVCLTVISISSFGQTNNQNTTFTVTTGAGACGNIVADFTSTTNGFTSPSPYTTGLPLTLQSGALVEPSSNGSGNRTITLVSPGYYFNNASLTTVGFTLANATSFAINVYGASTAGTNTSNTSFNLVAVVPVQNISNTQNTYCITINDQDLSQVSAIRYEIVLKSTTNPSNSPATFDNFQIQGTSNASGVILPVHFSALSVRKATEGAQVTWTVGTEQNVSGYDVEKSVDGRSFTKIGFVGAAGLSSYNFVDAKAGVVNFYRIKSVDIDGKYGYSTVVSLNGGAASVVVKAFMSDKSTLTVQHDAAQSGSRISVISMDGRVVKVQLPAQGAQQTKVDLSAAQTGLYIIRYDNGQGGSESIKIAK